MAIRIFSVLLLATSMTPAWAAPSAELKTLLDHQPALSDQELGGMRAGFITAGGAQFDFGASIRTMVNGQLALQTNLQWTDAGAVTQQLVGVGQSTRSQVNGTLASNLAKAGIASPIASSTGTAGNGVQTAGNAASPQAGAPAAAPAAASTPAVITGVEVPGAGGSTQVFANLSPNQIQSIILNSASGQNITQNTDITFTIYNFQAWQQQLAERMVSARLASEMLAASGFTAAH